MNVVPGGQLADPRLFNPYAGFGAGIGSGINMGSQLQDIVIKRQQAEEAARLAPLRQQALMQQLAAGRQQFGQLEEMNPILLERARAERHLADIALPGQEALAAEPTRIKQSEFTDLDDQGNLARYGSFKVIDKKTGEVGYQPRAYLGTVKTKQQLEEEKLNAQSMRDYHAALGNSSMQKAATADDIAKYKQLHPNVRTQQVYDKDLNVFEQVINPNGTLGAAVQVLLPNGQPAKRPANAQSDINLLFSGAGPASASVAPAAAPALNTDALSNLAGEFSQKSFATEGAAQAAAAAGTLKPGDKIIVAGVKGTWQ